VNQLTECFRCKSEQVLPMQTWR